MPELRKPSQPGPEIPDKLYFRIGEVARLLGVETHTLRFWEGEFPQLRVGKGGTGQRLYRRKDVEALLEIKRLLYDQGYTIPGARQYLQSRGKSRAAGEPKASAAPRLVQPAAAPTAGAPTAAAATAARLQRVRTGLQELSDLLSRDAAGPAGERPRSGVQAISANRSQGPQAVPRGIHLTRRSSEAAKRDRPAGTASLFDAAERPE